MAEHPPLLGEAELGAVGELAHLADVVDQRGGQEEVGVEARVELAGLEHERADGDRVLDQAAEVGVVAPLGAGRAPELRGVRPFDDEPCRHLRSPSWWISRDEVLQKSLELLDRAIGGGQEVAGVVRARLDPLDVVELCHQTRRGSARSAP